MNELNIDNIKIKIKNVLNKHHKDNNKKDIRCYHDRLNFACPICGDSDKISSKKRGNLYLNNLFYICYNCSKKISFVSFLNLFNEKVSIDEKLQYYNYIDNNTIYNKNSDEYSMSSLDKLIDFNTVIDYFNNQSTSWLVDIKPLQQNSEQYKYVKSRLIQNYNNIYEGVYRYFKNGKVVYRTNVIINLNKRDEKLIGFQLRNLERIPEKRFYKIVDFSEIYNYMNPNNILDEHESIAYNKLSHFYNILNVNFDNKITVFEGYLDSLFYPNSIGLVGATHDENILNFLLKSDDNLNIQFFYDNDETGIKKSKEMLNNNFNVFLWKKFFDDIKLKKIYRDKIKDLNALAILFKCPDIYNKYKLYKYFSIDKYDMIYI